MTTHWRPSEWEGKHSGSHGVPRRACSGRGRFCWELRQVDRPGNADWWVTGNQQWGKPWVCVKTLKQGYKRRSEGPEISSWEPAPLWALCASWRSTPWDVPSPPLPKAGGGSHASHSRYDLSHSSNHTSHSKKQIVPSGQSILTRSDN